MLSWFGRHWFLLALSLIVVTGFAIPTYLVGLTEAGVVRRAVVIVVLFLMALPLELAAFLKTIRRPAAPLLASSINMVVGPLLVIPFLMVLGPELAGGLAIALATPCTLASATVWTRRAGGNDTIAIMVTVITNLLCVILTPMWLYWLIGSAQLPTISLVDQVGKLSMLVLLPIILAQVVRSIGTVGPWATRRKPILSVFAQLGLLYIVLVGAISSALRWDQGQGSSIGQWALLIFAVCSIHLLLFFLGLFTSGQLGFCSEDRRAIAISGSQKTLMVGAEMGISLGLSVIPLLIYHLFQLLADTLLADWMKNRYSKNGTGF